MRACVQEGEGVLSPRSLLVRLLACLLARSLLEVLLTVSLSFLFSFRLPDHRFPDALNRVQWHHILKGIIQKNLAERPLAATGSTFPSLFGIRALSPSPDSDDGGGESGDDEGATKDKTSKGKGKNKSQGGILPMLTSIPFTKGKQKLPNGTALKLKEGLKRALEKD